MFLGGGSRDARELKNHAFFKNINWNDLKKKRVKSAYVPDVNDDLDTQNFSEEFTRLPNVISSGPKPNNTESFFQGMILFFYVIVCMYFLNVI